MIASSSSSPPTRIDWLTTMPPRLITATSDVPPPMSTTMLPVGSPTGRAGASAAGRRPSPSVTPGGLAPGQAGADRGAHRLLDQVRLTGAGAQARLLDRPLLDPGHTGGDADDDARMSPAVLVHLLNEVPQHLLCDIEVGDHTVLERADRGDGAGRAAEHALGLDPDGMDLARAAVDRDHAGLREDNAAAAHVDERVRGSEIDGHIATTEAGEIGEEAHASAGWTALGKGAEPVGESIEAVSGRNGCNQATGSRSGRNVS